MIFRTKKFKINSTFVVEKLKIFRGRVICYLINKQTAKSPYRRYSPRLSKNFEPEMVKFHSRQ